MSKVLVTGGNGYVAAQVIAVLLRTGQEVLATARSTEAEPGIRAAVRRGGADDAALEVVAADLTRDDGWAPAMDGVDVVHHIASPIPPVQPEDPDELIRPAREGTVRVLSAARDRGVRRVVMTSSFAAVGYTPKPVREYTEDDWTDPDTPGLPPYPRSKAIAERAAWDFVDEHPDGPELVVLNPTFIVGPSLAMALRSSLLAVKAIAEGTMPALPRQRFGVADVRDVADAHVRAGTAPVAAGRRYLLLADGPTITWRGLAEMIRDHLGEDGGRVSLVEAPGEEPAPLTIHNDRAKQELGWRPRAPEVSVGDTVDSLRQLGLLASP